jgi:hypothetical protein
MGMPERRPRTIDERFDEVTQAFADQRDFTMFCHDKLGRELRQEIRASEGRLTSRLDALEGRFGGLEGRVGGLEGRFDRLERRFDGLDGRFARQELLLTEILNEVKRR